MAYPSVDNAVATIVSNAKAAVVGDLIAFLEKKTKMSKDVKAALEEFKASMPVVVKAVADTAVVAGIHDKVGKKGSKKGKTGSDSDASGKIKAKRSPSVFNLYVKARMSEMTFGEATKAWKDDPLAQFLKDKTAEFQKDEEMDVKDAFEAAFKLYKKKKEDSDDEDDEADEAEADEADKAVDDDDSDEE
jgi:hypothetical protein